MAKRLVAGALATILAVGVVLVVAEALTSQGEGKPILTAAMEPIGPFFTNPTLQELKNRFFENPVVRFVRSLWIPFVLTVLFWGVIVLLIVVMIVFGPGYGGPA